MHKVIRHLPLLDCLVFALVFVLVLSVSSSAPVSLSFLLLLLLPLPLPLTALAPAPVPLPAVAAALSASAAAAPFATLGHSSAATAALTARPPLARMGPGSHKTQDILHSCLTTESKLNKYLFVLSPLQCKRRDSGIFHIQVHTYNSSVRYHHPVLSLKLYPLLHSSVNHCLYFPKCLTTNVADNVSISFQ